MGMRVVDGRRGRGMSLVQRGIEFLQADENAAHRQPHVDVCCERPAGRQNGGDGESPRRSDMFAQFRGGAKGGSRGLGHGVSTGPETRGTRTQPSARSAESGLGAIRRTPLPKEERTKSASAAVGGRIGTFRPSLPGQGKVKDRSGAGEGRKRTSGSRFRDAQGGTGGWGPCGGNFQIMRICQRSVPETIGSTRLLRLGETGLAGDDSNSIEGRGKGGS